MKNHKKDDGNGFMFHGGCMGCTNDISVCPGCQYMEANWDLPDLNPVNIEEEERKDRLRMFAMITAKTGN